MGFEEPKDKTKQDLEAIADNHKFNMMNQYRKHLQESGAKVCRTVTLTFEACINCPYYGSGHLLDPYCKQTDSFLDGDDPSNNNCPLDIIIKE